MYLHDQDDYMFSLRGPVSVQRSLQKLAKHSFALSKNRSVCFVKQTLLAKTPANKVHVHPTRRWMNFSRVMWPLYAWPFSTRKRYSLADYWRNLADEMKFPPLESKRNEKNRLSLFWQLWRNVWFWFSIRDIPRVPLAVFQKTRFFPAAFADLQEMVFGGNKRTTPSVQFYTYLLNKKWWWLYFIMFRIFT